MDERLLNGDVPFDNATNHSVYIMLYENAWFLERYVKARLK